MLAYIKGLIYFKAMGNSFLRSVVYLILLFLICKFLIFFLEWTAKEVALYTVVIMPIMFAVFSTMHMIFLILTSLKENTASRLRQ